MTTYINPPITTDPDQLSADAFDYLSQNIPGWEPADGNLETWMVYALARMVGIAADVAADVPLAVFRYYGSTIIGLAPVDAVKATAATTWTMVDNAGYTIPAGTNVGYAVAGDTLIPFVTTDDVTVAPGDTTTPVGGVQIAAIDAGVAANGLGPANIQLIDPLAYVDTITAVAVTSGGVDAESDSTYITRLIDYLQLMTPRPIFANDFAVLARQIAGVKRAAGIDNYIPARSFADAHTTNTSAIVTSPALAQFTADDQGRAITGAGIPGGTTILSVDSATQIHMSANATATATVTATIAKKTNAERAVTVSLIDAQGNPVSGTIKTAVLSYLQSLRETNFLIELMDPTYTAVAVDFTFTAYPGYDNATVQSAAVDAVTAYLSPATWGTDPSDTTGTSWLNDPVVRINEVIALLNGVAGLRYVNTITLNGGGVDVNLAGDIALPTAGTITGAPA